MILGLRASRKNGGLLPPAAITDLENDEDQMWGLLPMAVYQPAHL
ncbi:hypothetical protein C4K03_4483 [Pseudomonas synxantha]|uniref:Uncharacterized protein n=1 Tax=Pseudomonas synxantha TaxID=47883 RepID=A0A3G7UBN5_9PSED|nr:hypothetical protein C4K03_4483 [Pseudomonas synxantha]